MVLEDTYIHTCTYTWIHAGSLLQQATGGINHGTGDVDLEDTYIHTYMHIYMDTCRLTFSKQQASA